MKVKTNMLMDYLQGQAGWHEIMAGETEDERYMWSAAALLAAAEYAEGLVDSDSRIQRMDRALCFGDNVCFMGNEVAKVIRRWHFYPYSSWGDPDDLIDELTDASEDDYEQLLRQELADTRASRRKQQRLTNPGHRNHRRDVGLGCPSGQSVSKNVFEQTDTGERSLGQLLTWGRRPKPASDDRAPRS